MPKKVPPLTDTALKKARPADKQYTLSDGDGLRFIVSATGKRYFRFDYTRPTGKRNSISLGTYPEVSLAKARELRLEYRQMLSEGLDPSDIRRKVDTSDIAKFESISSEFYTKTESGVAASTAKNYKRYIKYMNEAFGSKDINDITIQDISKLLLKFDNSGKRETAERILRLLKSVYKYARSRGLVAHNTAYDVSARDLLSKKREKHYDFIDNEKEFAELLLAIDEYFGDKIVKLALQFLSMAFLRPGNVRGLRWDQIYWDQNIIVYSEGDMKSDRKHIVPITRQIRKVLDSAASLSGGRSEYVFPSPISNIRSLSENTLNTALKRMGFAGKMTSHGFRHTASTLLHENMHRHGISSEVIEMQMAHKDDNKIRGTYNHAQYLPERKRLMQWWCDYMDRIKSALEEQ